MRGESGTAGGIAAPGSQISVSEDARKHDQIRVVTKAPHRKDIDGLRAIAVTVVVLFHAGVPFLPGGFIGVDVFFVISGFLISGLLLREITDTNRISIKNFYARRIRRLIPLATLVLVTTVILSYLLLPVGQRQGTGEDVNAAALFFANWNFAAASADYWADGIDKSPVLHFWSLSVEEQYYMVWPMLMLLFVRRRRFTRFGSSTKRRAAILVAIVGIGSLALSVLTSGDQNPWAYFGLQTRAWELAAGAAVGLAAASLKQVPKAVAKPMMWLGLLMIFASAFLLNSSVAYPGSAALLPVGATVLVIAAGCSLATQDQPRWLTGAASQYIGKISYSWYLWHWPALIFVAVVVGTGATEAEERAGSPMGGVPMWIVAATVIGSFVIAAVTSKFVEQPIRRSRRLAARPGIALTAGVFAIVGVVVVSSLVLMRPAKEIALAPAADPVKVASIAGTAIADPTHELFLSQDPTTARLDKITLPNGCTFDGKGTVTSLPKCNIGAPNGSKTIVLVGDSKARVWAAGMGQAAKEQGWKLYAASMVGCPFLEIDWQNPKSPSCGDFRGDLTKQIAGLKNVDLVLIAQQSNYYQRSSPDEAQRQSMWTTATAQTLRRLGPAADKTVFVRDHPDAPQNVPECLIQSSESLMDCAWQTASNDDDLIRAQRAGARATGTTYELIDMNPYICPNQMCYPVDKNGTITFRDISHLTGQFSVSLWKVLANKIDKYL